MKRFDLIFRAVRVARMFNLVPAVYSMRSLRDVRWIDDFSIEIAWLWWAVGLRIKRV
jgi:hypothetical protein